MNKVAILSAILVASVAIIVRCAYSEAETKASKRYAVLTEIARDRVKLEIKDAHWTKLIGPNGFGGYRESLFYWATLDGTGPVFQNPELNENGLDSHPVMGSITIDRKNGVVVIDMKRVLSKSGEAKKTEPSPANGTYPIK